MAKISIDMKDGRVEKPKAIVGIDLGTTNSLVAYRKKDGEVVVVTDQDGASKLMPSILHFGEEGIVVGEKARPYLISSPERTIFSVKRLMGKSFVDIHDYRDFFGYKIIGGEEDELVKIAIDDTYYNPIQLSSYILAALKSRVEEVLDVEVEQAVITVPAYFTDAQRQATRDAGKLAGLDVLRIINEPTAASLAYGIGLDDKVSAKKIVVYDLGGGTFDVSVLHIEDGVFEVLASLGDSFLGGDDFDKAIVDYWVQKYSLTLDSNQLQELRQYAEQAKKVLSSQDHYKTEASFASLAMDRATFNSLIKEKIDRSIALCRQAMKDAAQSIEDIDQVLLVGGSTRIPYIKEQLEQYFKQVPSDELDPDQVVAIGAAVQADILAGNERSMLLLDVTPLSLGIETVGGLMDTIIPRNTKIPTGAGRNYTTSVDGQKNLKVAVYQGERDLVVDNRKLGEFILRDIPPMPAGIPKIEIKFLMDADGILQVEAAELRSNTRQRIEIKSSYGLSEEEMGKMLLESIQFAQTDMTARALIESKTEAQQLVLATHKFLQQNEALLSQAQKDTLKELVEALKSSIETAKNKDEIEQAMEKLNNFANPLAHEALDHHIAENMKGKKV